MSQLRSLEAVLADPHAEALEMLASAGARPAWELGTEAGGGGEGIDTSLMALFRDSARADVFDLLYQRTRGALLGLLRRVVNERGLGLDPTELLQDTFVNVYRYRGSFRDERSGSFRAWARTIAHHTVSRAAGRRRALSLQELPEGLQEPADPRPAPMRTIEDREDARALRQSWMILLTHYERAWRELLPRDRVALEMVEVEGLSYAEAAARLRVGRSNIKMILFRARARLLARMSRSMGVAPENLRAAG